MIDGKYEVEGQMSIMDLDPDIWSGRTSQERSAPASQKERTSKSSSRKSSGSSKQMPLMCLCLKAANGQKPDSSAEWVTMDAPFQWPGESTTLSTGGHPKDGSGLLFLQTSTDCQPERSCLTLNIGEKPRVPNPTYLSEILEETVDEKYNLSPRACRGILNRAAKRGKELPPILKTALENMILNESRTTITNESGKCDLESG